MSPLTKNGKDMFARYMYQKGKEFVGAAILLRQAGGFTHVSTHLICQGLELILKSLLLFKDYSKYHSLIKKNVGHNLVKLVDLWKVVINRNKVNARFYSEIQELNRHYISHGLRYGSLTDLLILPESIETKEVLKQISIILRKTDNKLNSD